MTFYIFFLEIGNDDIKLHDAGISNKQVVNSWLQILLKPLHSSALKNYSLLICLIILCIYLFIHYLFSLILTEKNEG